MYSDDPPNSLIWPKEKRKRVSQLLLPLTRKKEEIKEKKRLEK